MSKQQALMAHAFGVTAESYRVKFPSYRYICLLPHRNRIRASNLQWPGRKYLFSNPHVKIITTFCRKKCGLNSKEEASHDSLREFFFYIRYNRGISS